MYSSRVPTKQHTGADRVEALRVQLIAKPGTDRTGTSHYTTGLYRGLQAAGLDVQLTLPLRAPVPGPVQRGLKRVGLDAEAFFSSYPLRASLETADIYHLTSQTLATLLLLQRRRKPAVVTVLDIIPYLVRHDPQLNTFQHPVDYLFYRLSLAGLRRADALIAISNYTKRTLIDALGLPAERIHVVYPAVDREKFRPTTVPDRFRAKHGLDAKWRYVLYVGSEDPRKNLKTLLRAFALVRRHRGNVKLLKVGRAHFMQERQSLLSLIAELGIQKDVLFFERVSDQELPLFYNQADVVVMPSLYEGFGLPALEAMACGRPVVVADAASLPEVVGDAGAMVPPLDAGKLAAQIQRALEGQRRDKSSCLRSIARARKFDLARQAESLIAIYNSVSSVTCPQVLRNVPGIRIPDQTWYPDRDQC